MTLSTGSVELLLNSTIQNGIDMQTIEEIEQAAYMRNDQAMLHAITLARESEAAKWTELLETADYDVDSAVIAGDLSIQRDNQISEKCPDYEEYKQFFNDCFQCLNGHYPVANVTSSYDCSVIFDAINKGEQGDDEWSQQLP